MSSERVAVPEGQFITAGNASQLSDGASACVVMSAAEAAMDYAVAVNEEIRDLFAAGADVASPVPT